MKTADLPHFIDRWTIEYVRTYPPIRTNSGHPRFVALCRYSGRYLRRPPIATMVRTGTTTITLALAITKAASPSHRAHDHDRPLSDLLEPDDSVLDFGAQLHRSNPALTPSRP
jgi:hypothetical protein